MSLQDFTRLVASMRRAQKTAKDWPGDPAPARAAQGWEKQVDAAVKEIQQPPPLFPGEPAS